MPPSFERSPLRRLPLVLVAPKRAKVSDLRRSRSRSTVASAPSLSGRRCGGSLWTSAARMNRDGAPDMRIAKASKGEGPAAKRQPLADCSRSNTTAAPTLAGRSRKSCLASHPCRPTEIAWPSLAKRSDAKEPARTRGAGVLETIVASTIVRRRILALQRSSHRLPGSFEAVGSTIRVAPAALSFQTRLRPQGHHRATFHVRSACPADQAGRRARSALRSSSRSSSVASSRWSRTPRITTVPLNPKSFSSRSGMRTRPALSKGTLADRGNRSRLNLTTSS